MHLGRSHESDDPQALRVGVDGGDVLTWEGLSLAAVCGVLAVIWRTTSALPDLQRFGLAGGVVVVAGWLMRFARSTSRDEDHGRQPWTYWAPLVTAFALIVALNLVSRRERTHQRAWPWFRQPWSST
jgi:hypothetical protein